MPQVIIEDYIKEIIAINRVISSKNFDIKRSKVRLLHLKRIYRIVDNLSNKIFCLKRLVYYLDKEIEKLECHVITESMYKKILEIIRQEKRII